MTEFKEKNEKRMMNIDGKMVEGTISVCPHCGQEYIDEKNLDEVLEQLDNA